MPARAVPAPSRSLVVVVAALALAVALPGTAGAHGEDEHPATEEAPPAEATSPPRVGRRMGTVLEVRLPEAVSLGDEVRVGAVLTTPDGEPVRGAAIAFVAPASWGEMYGGPMLLGTATTGRDGAAWTVFQARTAGHLEVTARFAGDAGLLPSEARAELEVGDGGQLYAPAAGLRVPGVNAWFLAGVIALVWGLYLAVGSRLVAIARAGAARAEAGAGAFGVPAAGGVPAGPATTRRQFLTGLVPALGESGIAAFGAGLVAIVARSPRTHGNLLAPPATERYRRTPVALVGRRSGMRPLPPVLEREVSFARDVLPIFLAYGGPHVVPPASSPPPAGLRLDSYEGLMEAGVVVPGKPEESELVEHLLTPAIQMPPSTPPLPEELVQLIVTWIAQGARDN